MTRMKTAALISAAMIDVVLAGIALAIVGLFELFCHTPKIWRAARDPLGGIELEYRVRIWPPEWKQPGGLIKIHQTIGLK